MSRQEQALPKVSLLKDDRASSPEETQAALVACLFSRWPVGLGLVYVVIVDFSHVVAMTVA